MLRSVCFISRAYPDPRWPGLGDPLVEREAQMLAEAGVTVHVITGGGDGGPTSQSAGGLTIHRLPEPAQAGHSELGYLAAGMWSQSVGVAYRELDALARFDLVRVTDTFAATLHFGQYRRPETPVIGSVWPAERLLSAPGATPSPGEAALQALNLLAAEQFDVLLAASNTTIDFLRARFGRAPAMRLLPPPLMLARSAPRRPRPGPALRLVFAGALEPASRADLAIEALAAAREAGLNARLVLAGAAGFTAHGRPYREAVLEPLIAERRLGRWVRFAGDLDDRGRQRLLRAADCAIMPGFEPLLHRAAAAALAHGVPVLVGPTCALPDEAAGVAVCRTETADAFAADVVRHLADLAPLQHASRRDADRLRAICTRPALRRRYVSVLGELAEGARTQGVPQLNTAPGPLGIVVLATDPIGTRRMLAGILAHTPAPVQVYLVRARSDRALARCVRQLGPSVRSVECAPQASDAERRSLGLAAAVAAQPGAVAVLARGTEVHAGWYWRYLDALDPQSEVGMVLEAGPVSACARHVYATLTGAEPGADLASSPCLVVDAAAARQLGTFDPRLAPFWQDADYAMRARRLGYRRVSVSSGDRLIPGSTVEEPLLDAETQAYLAERWQRLRDGLADARQVLVVALADEVRHEPSLLSAYAQAFSAADDVTLAIYAPDADAASLERDLVPSVERAGLAAEDGADVLLLPLPRDRSEEGLAHAAHAVLSNVPATGALATLPRFDAGQVDAIRSLVHRCRRRAA